MDPHVSATPSTMARIEARAAAPDDGPVVMLNLNRYRTEAGFPDGPAYRIYMDWLEQAVGATGGSVLWRAPVDETVIGCDHDQYDEVLAVWYPSHAAFLALPQAEGAREMFRGRRRCVANAAILALPNAAPSGGGAPSDEALGRRAE